MDILIILQNILNKLCQFIIYIFNNIVHKITDERSVPREGIRQIIMDFLRKATEISTLLPGIIPIIMGIPIFSGFLRFLFDWTSQFAVIKFIYAGGFIGLIISYLVYIKSSIQRSSKNINNHFFFLSSVSIIVFINMIYYMFLYNLPLFISTIIILIVSMCINYNNLSQFITP